MTEFLVMPLPESKDPQLCSGSMELQQGLQRVELKYGDQNSLLHLGHSICVDDTQVPPWTGLTLTCHKQVLLW